MTEEQLKDLELGREQFKNKDGYDELSYEIMLSCWSRINDNFIIDPQFIKENYDLAYETDRFLFNFNEKYEEWKKQEKWKNKEVFTEDIIPQIKRH